MRKRIRRKKGGGKERKEDNEEGERESGNEGGGIEMRPNGRLKTGNNLSNVLPFGLCN